jgi:methyl-accepting chemotaxis protein
LSDDSLLAVYQALDRVQAIVEFELDGTIMAANDNFLRLFGYESDELIGKHHRIFCEPGFAASADYRALWEKLQRGENACGQFKRLARDGTVIWIQSSYNPVFDARGKPARVVKFATDITADKLRTAEHEGLAKAIDRSQGVIEFALDGTVLTANDNFLRIFGYERDEIVGRHHRMFCLDSLARSPAYEAFWERLRRGEYHCDEFERVGKGGEEVWIRASYNPVLDPDGRPMKIVKFATDVTGDVRRRQVAMLEMSTPVTKIWDGVLFAPIVGIVDSSRAVDIMNRALASIAESRAHTLMLDIGGVAVVDTAVANHLIKVAKAAVLMGCETIISGISPAIAQTVAELGIDLGAIRTRSTIEASLQAAMAKSRAAQALR